MRNRRFGLRKMSVAATALLLVLAACSGDESDNEHDSPGPYSIRQDRLLMVVTRSG